MCVAIDREDIYGFIFSKIQSSSQPLNPISSEKITLFCSELSQYITEHARENSCFKYLLIRDFDACGNALFRGHHPWFYDNGNYVFVSQDAPLGDLHIRIADRYHQAYKSEVVGNALDRAFQETIETSLASA